MHNIVFCVVVAFSLTGVCVCALNLSNLLVLLLQSLCFVAFKIIDNLKKHEKKTNQSKDENQTRL